MVRVTMELEVPKRPTYNINWSNMFCNGRGKRGYVAANAREPWQRNAISFF